MKKDAIIGLITEFFYGDSFIGNPQGVIIHAAPEETQYLYQRRKAALARRSNLIVGGETTAELYAYPHKRIVILESSMRDDLESIVRDHFPSIQIGASK
jgi:hypothetical protein